MNILSTIAPRRILVVLIVALMLPIAAACGGGDGGETAESTPGVAQGGTSALLTMDGKGVSATNEELVLETPGGQWTFKIRPEDVAAVDPEHFNSHVGVPEIAFRVFFVTQDGVDYAVSVDEIDGSTLGF